MSLTGIKYEFLTQSLKSNTKDEVACGLMCIWTKPSADVCKIANISELGPINFSGRPLDNSGISIGYACESFGWLKHFLHLCAPFKKEREDLCADQVQENLSAASWRLGASPQLIHVTVGKCVRGIGPANQSRPTHQSRVPR
jgi:hypothetical protein